MAMDYSSYAVDSNTSRDDTALANELLRRVNLPSVNAISECTSSVFVALCEGILGDPLKGVSYVPVTKEDEIHNVQLVVDHLAEKVLHCDLSHISGRAIVDEDRVAIQYLLEILLGVMDYIMEDIESEGSTTDNEDLDHLVDPDTMTRGTVSAITAVLREELGPRSRKDYFRPAVTDQPSDSHTISDISKHLSQPNTQSEGESTAELIKLGVEDKPEEVQWFRQRDRTTASEPTQEPFLKINSTYTQHDQAQKHPMQEEKAPQDEAPSTDASSRQSLEDHPTVIRSQLRSAVGDKPPAASSSPRPVSMADSTTGSPSKPKDHLTVQDLTDCSGTFSSVSWPKSLTNPPPSELDTLGMRTRPAWITKDRPASGLDSLLGNQRETGSLQHRHVHTHHHYHQPGSNSLHTSPAGPKSPPHATISRPPDSERTSPAKRFPTRDRGKRKEPKVAPSWHERLATHDDMDILGTARYKPGHTYPDTLRSTYPAPSERRPASSASTRGGVSVGEGVSTDRYSSRRRQRDLYVEDVEDWLSSRLKGTREEEDLPPRPRRVAFLEDYDDMDRPQRSFYHEKLAPVTSRFIHEISDSEADSDSDHLSQCSDTAVDYQQPTSYPASHLTDDPRRYPTRESQVQPYQLRPRSKVTKKQHPQSRPKSVLLPMASSRSHRVRFEEALEADATGPMSKIRKKLNKENRKHSRQKEVLRYVYKSNLEEAKSGLKKQVDQNKRVLDKQDAEYRKVFSGPKTSKYQPAQKYTTKVTAERPSRTTSRGPSRSKRKRSASASPTMHRHKRMSIGDDEMLPTLMQEFPFLHVSPQTAHDMWAKQMRQMEQLTKMGLDQGYKKTKTQLKMEEAERRQETLLKIMKKELGHNQRMREIRERRSNERAMQRRAQEQRQVNARARRYYDEFQLRAKSRMMKRRTREEQIFKKLFENGLKIQKARISDLRKYAREKREESAKRQQDEIDSLENYYRNQFSMLAEAIAKERYELQTRDKAQTKVMERMKRDMRRKMEQEAREFQEQMYRDEDTEYFRQLEADRMRRELQMASYKTTI